MEHKQADNLGWLRVSIGLLICVVFAILQYSSVPSDGLSTADRYLYDTRISVAPPFDSNQVVIVDIDEKSLAAIGRWPWSRRTVADLATRITEEGNAAVLGFDVVFAEPEREDALADQQLARALNQKPVVLGYYFTSDRGGQTSGLLPPPAFESTNLPANMPRLVWNGFGANLPMLQTASADAGFFNPMLDPDGVTRSLPLLTEFDGQIYESLALRLLRRYLQDTVLVVAQDKLQIAGERASVDIPLSEGLTALVPYTKSPGPGKRRFPYVSASDVLSGKVDWKLFDDKIVLVGTSAPGLNDMRATPVDAAFPGVEVHATLINGALENRMIARVPDGQMISALMLLVVGGLLAFAAPRAGAFGVIIATFTSAAALFVWNVVAFVHLGWVLPLAASLLTILMVGLFNLAAGYAIEGRARRAVVDLFSEYVSPSVVEKMARDPLNYHGAISVNSELTVMFADIRGFTRIAENMPPEMLKEYLNEVLTDLTECIYRYNGTVDKYMGDAVMAFWGAPVADPEHAENAVRAAIDMQAAITRLSDRFAARGFPSVAIGIGINTGLVRVGDMGSKLRRAYTVIGDSVNLASRLESLTKHYRVPIIVGESTRNACREIHFKAIDTVVVAGRQGAVQIFSPQILSSKSPVANSGDNYWDSTKDILVQAKDQPSSPIAEPAR